MPPPASHVPGFVAGHPPGTVPGDPSGGTITHVNGRPLAGFWQRFGAWLLDVILYGLVSLPFLIAGVGSMIFAVSDCDNIAGEIRCTGDQLDARAMGFGIALAVAGFVLAFVLYVRAMARTGQPWGARIAGVKVVRSDTGAPIGVGRALGRTLFAGLLSGQVCYLGYFWMLWDGKNQTWHDKVVDSVVVS
jgi:uncharacterized RDD family membrane protein YckC